MDIFEKFNSKFGKWYEGLFGGDTSELRPKDVLRKIIAAMEDHRKEGFDSQIYVPNKYVLELSVDDPEEREYLLSFLDEEELVSVLQKFMAQNGYKTRGPLDFTISEVPETERASREKLRVKVRYEKEPTPARSSPPLPETGGETGRSSEDVPVRQAQGHTKITPGQLPAAPPASGGVPRSGEVGSDDLPTVYGIELDEEPGTVPAIAWAALAVTAPDGRKSHFSLTKPIVTIGRSRNAANDLILDTDGMVSKSHARLERERDGHWTLYDLGSTNGVKVGDVRVDGNRVLRDGDEILIGATKLAFQQADAKAAEPDAPASASAAPLRRARLIGPDGMPHVLASETWIGRAVTSDIVLHDPSVSTKHARIVAPDAQSCFLEDLGSEHGTLLNGLPVAAGRRAPLTDGDILQFGQIEMRFTGGGR